MSFLTQLKLKIKKTVSKYCTSSIKRRASTGGFPGPKLGDGTKPAKRCLSCQTVWIEAPSELCTVGIGEVSPHARPAFREEGESTKKKGGDGEGGVGEAGQASGGECEAQGEATEEGPTLDNILRGDFPKEIGEGFSWKD
ncbi:unnamed protein product [Tuber aestivum]|uniref:Uncharacterized protein n=1 Tax=Tuber aestivum TaxID=59557 RepID=A0A292Q3G6_9PEZI|nr:unnamed protein product [Tuber aestivum]